MFSRRAIVLGLVCYVALISAVVALVISGRASTLRTMDTDETRAQWQAWREAPPNQNGASPVRRQPPSTDEPPALLLMRDHFAVVLSGAVFFSSLLFGAFWFFVAGALKGERGNGRGA